MFPFIWTGDRITINPYKNPAVGDIIVFRRDEQIVCHRLVKIFEKDGVRYYQTHGDTHFGLDEPVASDRILGKVTKIEREKVSFSRRILLLFSPILRFGKLNAFVISALIKIKYIYLNRH